jgi:peptidase E
MKLFLASEAKHPDCIKKLDALINGLKGKSIAYIPTASNGENPYGQWQTESTTWKLVNTLDANVTPVSLEDYKDSSVIDALKGKDSGSVYVGSSAGSMVAAQTLSVTEWYLGEGEPGASIFPGLSLIDFEIYPHYEDEMLPEIKKYWDGKKLCLLKNGEAITVIDGETTILGEERFLES